METIDLQLFKNVIAEGRNNNNLLDSFSPNQFKTKERLIGHIRDLNIVDNKSEITILGGDYNICPTKNDTALKAIKPFLPNNKAAMIPDD